jgi:hypothetical protein
MCQFKSGVAVRVNESEVVVKFLPLNDSHYRIRNEFDIGEDNLCLSSYSTPVELIPTKLDFEDITCWQFVFDNQKPDWWVDGMTDQCIDQLLKAAKLDFDAIMNGQKCEDSLDLFYLTSIPEGFNPIVGANLWLHSLKSIPKGFSPVVGGDLDLKCLVSVPEGFNPVVGGCLILTSLIDVPEGFSPVTGENLYMNSLIHAPRGFNPVVGGGLWMADLISISEDFSPVVGKDLYLFSLMNIPDSARKNVSGRIHLKNLNQTP